MVLLFGFTAILGKLIALDAVNLVFYRMGIAAVAMGLLTLFVKKGGFVSQKDIWKALGIGSIVAAHWITFFLAVKVSNVSVTLGTMASGTLFVSLIEPILSKRKFYWVELLIGSFIVIGLYLITQFAFHYINGILIALLSAFLASLFGVLNKQLIDRGNNSLHISFVEMLSGFLMIMLFMLFSSYDLVMPAEVVAADWPWILILAIACTAYAFVATVYLLKFLGTYTVSLAINLEPVYGIILAFLIFGESEKMHVGFYFGTVLILLAIFIYPSLMKRFHKI